MFHFATVFCLFVTLFLGAFGQKPECTLDKDSGNGKDAVQKFYFNSKWGTCFGFKYTGKGGNGNKFNSFSECQGNCALLDGTSCTGPLPSKSPLNADQPAGFDCATAKCPSGYTCLHGMRPECCETKQYDAVQAAFDEKCPDGSKAGGSNAKGYFQATFAETCKDLVCDKGQKCVQVNKQFAKCCGGK